MGAMTAAAQLPRRGGRSAAGQQQRGPGGGRPQDMGAMATAAQAQASHCGVLSRQHPGAWTHAAARMPGGQAPNQAAA